MRERDPAEPPLAMPPFSGVAPGAPARSEDRRKHCAQCGGPFGLIRRQRGGKQFCSAQCLADYRDDARQSAKARPHWYAFLSQRF